MQANRTRHAVRLVAVVALLGTLEARPQTVEYEISHLPFPEGNKITACLNASGVVAATVSTSEGPRGFVFQDGVVRPLGVPLGVDPALLRIQFVSDINASGTLVGHHDVGLGKRPVVWENAVARELEVVNGGSAFLMAGINDAGMVSGSGWPFAQFSPGWTNENGWDEEPFFISNRDPMRPMLWGADGVPLPVPLPVSKGALDAAGIRAEGINSKGELVYSQWNRERFEGFHWMPGKAVVRLASLGYRRSVPRALNDDGLVVGSVLNSGVTERPVIWRRGEATDLGFVSGFSKGWCCDVNNDGVVLGQLGWWIDAQASIFRWSDGEMVDLQGRIRPGSGWDIRRAFAIDADGRILGSGIFEGQEEQLFLMTPHATSN